MPENAASNPTPPPTLAGFQPEPLSALPAGGTLAEAIHHVTGDLLAPAGTPVSPVLLRALSGSGITHVYRVPPARSKSFQRDVSTVVMGLDVHNLLDGGILASDLHSSDGARLFLKGEPWNQQVRDDLRARGVTQLRMPREHPPGLLDQVTAFRRRLSAKPSPREASIDLDPRCLAGNPKRACSVNAMEFLVVQGALVKGALGEEPMAPPLLECLSPTDPSQERSEEEKAVCVLGVQDLHSISIQLFDAARKNRQVDGRDVGKLAERIIRMMLQDKELLLSAMVRTDVALPAGTEDLAHLPSHAVRVGVLAINIATMLGYGDRQVYELGYGALLADLGMTRVPPAILEKNGALTEIEMSLVRHHPIHSLNMLQNFRMIPHSSPLIAYQSHERNDKSGYPKGRPGKLLHRFAKIVSVADAYCAITAPRTHRQARLPYQAIEELLRVSLEGKVPRDCMEALLRCIGLYPIGSWVQLSSGDVGRVVAANPTRYDRPILRVHFEGERRCLSRLLDLSQYPDEEPKVVKAIPAPEGMEDAMAGI